MSATHAELLARESQRAISRAEYEHMIDQGFFEDERVELLYGRIVEMSPQNHPHSWAVEQLTHLLVPLRIAGKARVRIQLPMAASADSEPDPDVIVSPMEGSEHPSAAWLLIEVADSSLQKDRELKARLYAECGVPEYWVVNLVDHVVEVFREPREGEYTLCEVVRDEVSPQRFPEIRFAVSELFSP